MKMLNALRASVVLGWAGLAAAAWHVDYCLPAVLFTASAVIFMVLAIREIKQERADR